MNKIKVVNVDIITPTPGDIVRSSTQAHGVLLAQANSVANTKGIRGVWADIAHPGYSGTILEGPEVEVNCTELPAVGDQLYLSATVKGKATKTAPAISIPVGVVSSIRVLGSTYKATVNMSGGVSANESDVTEAIEDLYTGRPSTGSIVCPDVEDLIDGGYLTISDGTSSIKLEPRAKAVSTVTLEALEDVTDNATVIVDDGTSAATTFEAQVSPTAVAATGSIVCIAKANLIDGETVTINDGTNGYVLEFDTNSTVTGVNVAVNISAATTDAEVATALANAINGTAITITATADGATINLVADTKDDDHNVTITDTVAAAGFTVTGMSGGVTGFEAAGGGVLVVDLQGANQDDYASDFVTAINAVGAGLLVTAGGAQGAAFTITRDATRSVTLSVTGTAVASSSVVSGGLGAASLVSGGTVVDVTGLTTAAQIAPLFTAAINDSSLELTATTTGATVNLVNNAVGPNNVAITETTSTVFDLTGMEGGYNAITDDMPVLSKLAANATALLALLD